MFGTKKFERTMNVLSVILFTGFLVKGYGTADTGYLALCTIAVVVSAIALVVIE